MEKKVTLRDISAELGLSTAAVSKALRGLNGISEQTRKAVIATAKKYNYKGFTESPQEPKLKSEKILFLVDQRFMTEPHTTASYFFMDKSFKEEGLQLTLHALPASNREEAIEEAKADPDVIAHILFGRFPGKTVEDLRESKKPLFLIDHYIPYADVDAVLVDDYAGAFLAVEHFVKRGHLRIGFVGDNRLSPSFRDRHRGFVDALEYWGVEVRPEYIYDLRFADAYGDIQFNRLHGSIDFGHLPTAFFCANDPIALVLNNLLKEEGIATPDEVSIIGFDNLETCQWQSPPLTSLNYPREEIALQTIGLIRWRLEHPDAPGKKVMIRPRLVARQSVAVPKKGG